MPDIREHVFKLANSSVVKSFYSTGIAKRLKMPISEVEKELNQMVEEGLIEKKYDLLCPNESCLRTLDTKQHKKDFKSEYTCDVCGEEEITRHVLKEKYSGIGR